MLIHADENSVRATGEQWHSDVSCDPEPPMGSILRMHTTPEADGDTRPDFQCRIRWTKNSMGMWDNRCTQHHAIWDYWPATRTAYRVTVRGEVPV